MEEKMSKEEQVGFHKGSLSTLSKERSELGRMMSIVEQLMQMHIKALSELGVNVLEQEKSQANQKDNKPRKPIEELL